MNDRTRSSRYRSYVLAILALVYFFYLVDRSALIVTQELIREEFNLSDTAMGLLTGTLYGVAYALAGIPIGWAVDRVNRRNLLVGVLSVWSALTVLSGACVSFWQLALARIGVGAAESGGAPAALSILSDLFPPERRGTVSSIFFAGAGIGGILSFVLGGYIAQHFGWRMVFVAFGLPGLVLALVVLFTVNEPARKSAVERPKQSVAGLLRETWQTMRYPGLGSLYLATGIYMFSVAGVGTWTVPFFMRSFDIDLATIGLVMGLGAGVFGVLGQVGAGVAFDWARRFGPRGPLMVVVIGSVIHVAAVLVVLLSGNLVITIVALCAMGATTTINAGPTNAAISQIAPPAIHGTSFALYAVISNVIGAGFGPAAVGILSDLLGSDGASLRTAMVIMALLQLIAVFAFLRASTVFARITTAADTASPGQPAS
ncbi:MAG: MFS transporter [Novosphingobium sp.]|nr:MFS transporter [Novosphingobium sp.]MCP5403419.1 MFS transporter [Novosphingobium sp.]